jgi:hypothetical protein
MGRRRRRWRRARVRSESVQRGLRQLIVVIVVEAAGGGGGQDGFAVGPQAAAIITSVTFSRFNEDTVIILDIRKAAE